MKHYKVEFENHEVTWSHVVQANGRTDAENKAESLIEAAFFSDKAERHYFYTLTEIGTDKRRVIRAMNVMAPTKPL